MYLIFVFGHLLTRKSSLTLTTMLKQKYVQTYSNNHLHKTTNAESAQATSHTIVTV